MSVEFFLILSTAVPLCSFVGYRFCRSKPLCMEFTVISPIDGSEYLTQRFHDWSEIGRKLQVAKEAQRDWFSTPVEQRVEVLQKWVEEVYAQRAEAAEELTYQMGRPLDQAAAELDAFLSRSRRVLDRAQEAVAARDKRSEGALKRFVRQEALGVVLVQAAWNYPYIIAAHSVVPALATGNAVLLKYSNQTPLCGARLEDAFVASGGPTGLLQAIRIPRNLAQRLCEDERIAQVAVTGALPSGKIERKTRRYIGRGLDLGGKDPAYIRPDADLEVSAGKLVKAAYSNAGQSCCGVERIYVHQDVFTEFVEILRSKVEGLKVGDPRDPQTTLGPMVRFQSAIAVYDQVVQTIRQGATPLLPQRPPDRAYFYPQVLVDVDHSMSLMSEETFGPAVGVMKVDTDAHAIELMNDSRYALGASVWTADTDFGLEFIQKVKTSTSYVNHCDYLDPAIAFLGVNDSPRGFTLSHIGFEMLTSARSYSVYTGS
jgi:acyl-CoA reductase-like NAD-dependent aldehyde dehydrogenase